MIQGTELQLDYHWVFKVIQGYDSLAGKRQECEEYSSVFAMYLCSETPAVPFLILILANPLLKLSFKSNRFNLKAKW